MSFGLLALNLSLALGPDIAAMPTSEGDWFHTLFPGCAFQRLTAQPDSSPLQIQNLKKLQERMPVAGTLLDAPCWTHGSFLSFPVVVRDIPETTEYWGVMACRS